MRPRGSRNLARFAYRASPMAIIALSALAGVACGGTSPPASVPAQSASVIRTATPYAHPPQPIIVDPSGAVAGNQPNFRELTYRIEAGDTLLAIALRFDTTVEAIIRRNTLTNASDLKIGQDLIIPTNAVVVATAVPTATAAAAARTPTPVGAAPTSTPVAGVATAAGAPSGTPASGTPTPGTTTVVGGVRTYVVEAGDTASGIANQFGVATQALADANNRTIAALANIKPGDRLVIPPAR